MPRNYPLHVTGRDERFSLSLVDAVAQVLVRHGYPDPRAEAADRTRLQLSLFRFCYGTAQNGGGL